MDLEEVKKSKESKKVEHPTVFYVVLILLAASIGLIIFGLSINPKKVAVSVSEKETVSIESQKTNDQDIGKYFESSAFGDTSLDQDQFLKDDPFREKCAATAGDGKPSVSSNTVCLR